ncbi:MAG: hypothetical protein LBB25_00760 [Holosporaceae bacterium]|jgi:hypothetical protein|nr:hypothetical protein [Holosporaceae bacterium]
MQKVLFMQLLLCSFVYAGVDFGLSVENLSNQIARIEPVRSSYSKVRMNGSVLDRPVLLKSNDKVDLDVESLTPSETVHELDALQIVSGTKKAFITIHPSLLDEPLISVEQDELNVRQDYFQYGVGRVITIPKSKTEPTLISRLFSVIHGLFA